MPWCADTNTLDGAALTPCVAHSSLQLIPCALMLTAGVGRLAYLMRRPVGHIINISKLRLYIVAWALSISLLVIAVTQHSNDTSLLFATSCALVSTLLAILLSLQEQAKGNGAGSVTLTVYLVLDAIARTMSLCVYSVGGAFFGVYAASAAISVLLMLVEGLSRATPEPGMLPAAAASPFGKMSFLWLTPLMTRNLKSSVTASDVHRLPFDTESAHLWGEHLERVTQDPRPSNLLFWGIMRRQWVRVALAVGAQALAVAMLFTTPVLLDNLISYVQARKLPNPPPALNGYLIAVAMFAASMLKGVLVNQALHLSMQIKIREQATVMMQIAHKALKLSVTGQQTADTGKVVTRMAVDAESLATFCLQFNDVWSGPATIVVGLIILYLQLGVSSLLGIAMVIIIIPMCNKTTAFFIRSNSTRLQWVDKRVQLMTEIIHGIKSIKFFATESLFKTKVAGYRHHELSLLRKMLFGLAISFGIISMMPALMALASIGGFLAFSNEPLTAQRVFVSLNIFKILYNPLNSLMGVFGKVTRAKVAYSRIVEFLDTTEVDRQAVVVDRTDNRSGDAVAIRGGSFGWRESAPVDKDTLAGFSFSLSNINLTLMRGTLSAVAGRVGQGKSSLLHAILGEMIRTSGSVEVNGSVAYVAQHAWLINGTLRENILLGRPLDEQRYWATVSACALLLDLETLPEGDHTLIGDKGITLSGGQKARVSLARAVYADADIYLLDDCLSAVDAHVDKHIFRNVIGKGGVLSGKTVILVTHGVHHLQHCDNVVLLKDGRVAECGTYEALMASNGDVCSLVSEHLITRSATGDTAAAHDEVDLVSCTAQTQGKPTVKEAAPAIRKPEDDSTSEAGTWTVLVFYLRSMGVINTAIMGGILVLFGASMAAEQIWLAQMSDDLDTGGGGNKSAPMHTIGFNIGIYAAITALDMLSLFALNHWVLVRMNMQAANALHNQLLRTILRVPMSWFDVTPAGRITNRFSSDIASLDYTLPLTWWNFISVVLEVVVAIVLVGLSTPWVLILVAVCFGLLCLVQRMYIAASQTLKRMESASKTPVYQLFGECMAGLVTIRAYDCEEYYFNQIRDRLDYYVRVHYHWLLCSRWLAFAIDSAAACIVFSVALTAVLTNVDAKAVGLGVVNASSIMAAITYVVRFACDLENEIVAVERIREYSILPSEGPEHNAAVDASWPPAGSISFKQYTTAYNISEKPVLNNLDITVRAGEKIGICGRTGAGKSTITMALFRIIEAVAGNIEIDGQDISKVGLTDLRSRLTIIPQDPMLFRGTIRDNLDPLNKHDDAAVWNALQLSNMKSYVSGLQGKLQAEVESGGSNFSAGQRQLMALASALLRKQRIVVFDEATSATDAETDALVQRTIRTEFKDCTVLTIAHRIATIMDSDRILVLDQGQVLEFDTPQALLQDPESAFAKLVNQQH
ncbi:hypothetical protein RI367_004947 [Sorochytrium milnesiophthora]